MTGWRKTRACGRWGGFDMRLFVLILGFILMVPAGLYMAWQGLREVPAVARLTDDFASLGAQYSASRRGLEQIGALVDRAGRISQAMGAAARQSGGDNAAMGAAALGVLAADADAEALEAFLTPEAFSFRRQVLLEFPVTPAQFLGPGEALPGPDWTEAFVNARLVLWAEESCAVLTAAFASGCKVADFRAQTARGPQGAEGALIAQVTLLFTANTPAGRLPGAETAPQVQASGVNLAAKSGPGGAEPVDLATQMARLRGVLHLAEEACAAQRAALGNCMVTRVSLRADGRASAELSALLPRSAAAATAAPATN